VIDEASTPKSSKATKQIPKSVLSLPLEIEQEVSDRDSSPPASPSAIQAQEVSSTSPQPED